ncbi:MAG: hypothetical protein QS98_C0004G0053 [archaeon GW2011_AR3]|nr:MAG: hypothetical protein QS98_C0004G0053 [archaeon GW2011_AR3]MBS3109606.1 hypothetical protein [Candidatus Woesearchaeota archaeon]
MKQEASSIFRKHGKEILAGLILLVLAGIYYREIFSTTRLNPAGTHYIEVQTLFAQNYLDAVYEHGTLPFWTRSWFGGHPFFTDPQVFFVNLTFAYLMLFKQVILAINLSLLSYLIIGLAGMYFLAKYITNNVYASMIAGFVYIFNEYILQFIIIGNPSIAEPYMLIPWILLFVIKALKEGKNFFLNIALAAALFACQVMSGGIVILLYTWVIVGIYLGLEIILALFSGNHGKKTILRIVVIFVALAVLAVALSASKLLPDFSLVEVTNRAAGVSYAEYIGSEKYFYPGNLYPVKAGWLFLDVGLVAALLAIMSLKKMKNRYVVFGVLLALVGFLLAFDIGLGQLFYNYAPGFRQMRNLQRALVLFVFAMPLLAGMGYTYLETKLGKMQSTKKWMARNGSAMIFFLAVLALIFANVWLAKWRWQTIEIKQQIDENQLARYLENEIKGKGEIFRVYNLDVGDIIAAYGFGWYSRYGIEHYGGGGSIWTGDYVQYTAIARQYNPAKLLGLANVKYLAAKNEINVPGFTLVRKFDECASCEADDLSKWVDGPYLYSNDLYLPRYYLVDYGVLILGAKADVDNVAFQMLLQPGIDPGKLVITKGAQGVSDYSENELMAHDMIILLQNSYAPADAPKLKAFVEAGGILVPDVFNPGQSLSFENLTLMLSRESSGRQMLQIKPSVYGPNRIEFRLNGEKGLFFLGEKFYMFPEWKASINGKEIRIHNANGIGSLVILNGKSGDLVFSYVPAGFVKGVWLTIAGLALSILLIIMDRKMGWSQKYF